MEDIVRVMAGDGTALFVGRGTWTNGVDVLALQHPSEVITANAPEEVGALLDRVEAAQRDGCYVAGYLCYEAGAAFGLPNHPPLEEPPLGWMAAYPPEHAILLGAGDLGPHGEQLDAGGVSVELDVSPEEYIGAIGRIKELIASGDTYQVNHTCRACFSWDVDPAEYFLQMVRGHPVPYAVWLNLGGAQVLSMSPELLLSRRGDELASKPMKGTRARGRTCEEDRAQAAELVASVKDRAENLMIVDMVRNDLGRVCEIGSVSVPELFAAERYRTVWQMTSTVTGTVRRSASLAEIFAAVFPGASVTGAPKRRTMEIIRELEPDQRGVYCGATGLFEPGAGGEAGDFTLNLPIRTLVHRDGRFRLGIGSGIVWDSDPRGEYEETLLKSQFAFRLSPEMTLFETLLLAEDGAYAWEAEHVERLRRSAEFWGFEFDAERMRERLRRHAAESGALPRVVRVDLGADGGLTVTSRELPAAPARPLRLLLSGKRVDPGDRLLYHKTSLRDLYDRGRAEALEAGFDEMIFRNTEGHVTEGAITSIFARLGEEWVTPPVSDGLLAGIWRAAFAAERDACERSMDIEELARADEVIVGNSVRGAMPAGSLHALSGNCLARWGVPAAGAGPG